MATLVLFKSRAARGGAGEEGFDDYVNMVLEDVTE